MSYQRKTVVWQWSSMVAVVALGAAGLLGLSATPLSAAAQTCWVKNLSSGLTYGPELQRAIDDASPGSRVQVRGRCVGHFTIDKSLALVGARKDPYPIATLDGEDNGTVLVTSGQTSRIWLVNLTITGGRGFDASAFEFDGGGIYNDGARIFLAGSTSVRRNVAEGYGGGIYNHRGWITLRASASVASNVGGYSGAGGGIFNHGGTVTLKDSSSVSGNVAGYQEANGGGIYNISGAVQVKDKASISGNMAYEGGGIYNQDRVTVQGSASIRDNTASRGGGGIYDFFGQVTLQGSASIASNTATGVGGGTYIDHGALTLKDASSITGNTAVADFGGGIARWLSADRLYACNSIGSHEWTGAISPNTPDDPPTPSPITCS